MRARSSKYARFDHQAGRSRRTARLKSLVAQSKFNYLERRELLKQLGFSSYGDYLQSQLWKDIREKTLRFFKVCHCCSNGSREVHHMTYSLETLSKYVSGQHVALCKPCHNHVEFARDPDSNKRVKRFKPRNQSTSQGTP